MIVCVLYYYDKPLLRAWLSHYCQLDCVEGIFIQNQNWSTESTLYLLETVAKYVNEYGKKITLITSPFVRVDGRWSGQGKNAQFYYYGEAVIRNMLLRHVKDEVFISGAMDEVLYGDDYNDTNAKLREFEDLARARADENLATVGFSPLYCVFADGIYPCAVSLSHRRAPEGVPPNWRHRLFRFPMPFRRNPEGGAVHDTTYQALRGGRWVNVTPHSMLGSREETGNHEHYFSVDLKLLHYHTLVRPSFKSTEFIIPKREEIQNPEKHPQHYLKELLKN